MCASFIFIRDKYLNVWIKTIVPMITISIIDLYPNGNT